METILKKVEEIARGAKDMVGKAKRIRTFPTAYPFPSLLIGKNQDSATEFSMTESAFKQFCLLLNIPDDYIRRCPPDLRTANINFWLSTLADDAKWALRAKEKIIRGILPGSTFPFSNVQVFKTIKELEFFKDKKIVTDWTYFDDSVMHVRLILPEFPILFEDEARTKGIMAGLHISYSEIGNFGLRIDFITYREKSNSTIITMTEGKRFYRPGKSWSTPEEMKGSIEAALAGSFPGKIPEFGSTIEKMRKKEMKDFKAWADKLRKKYKFSIKLAERAAEIFDGQEDKSMWMAVNSISRVAREKLDGEKRYSIEALAGNILARG